MSGKSNNVRSESQVDKAYHATEQVLFEIGQGVLIKLKDKGFRGSVIIPDSATSIGKYAFCRCGSLTSIEVSDNVTSIGRARSADVADCGESSLTAHKNNGKRYILIPAI